jgi:hypothetical protein
MDELPSNDQGLPPPEQPTDLPPTGESEMESESTPSWEHTDKYGFFGALIRTIGEVLFHPETTFRNMRMTGIGAPFLYGWLLKSIFSMIALYQFKRMMYSEFCRWMPDEFDCFPEFDFFPALFLIIPFGVALGMFILTGILHVCLMIAGGAKRDIEATFRVVAYSTGATAIWNIIPWVGDMISSIWQLVCQIIGLKEAHQTTYGRVILAFLIPLIVCCGLGILLLVPILGGISL